MYERNSRVESTTKKHLHAVKNNNCDIFDCSINHTACTCIRTIIIPTSPTAILAFLESFLKNIKTFSVASYFTCDLHEPNVNLQ